MERTLEHAYRQDIGEKRNLVSQPMPDHWYECSDNLNGMISARPPKNKTVLRRTETDITDSLVSGIGGIIRPALVISCKHLWSRYEGRFVE